MQSKVAGVVGEMDTLALVQIADDVALELRRHLARGEQALFNNILVIINVQKSTPSQNGMANSNRFRDSLRKYDRRVALP